MKKRVVLLISITLCFIITGCMSDTQKDSVDNSQEQIEVSKEAKQEVITDFLVEFFNFNCNGRYDTFEKAMLEGVSEIEIEEDTIGIQPLTESQQNAYDDYYLDLAQYATEDCVCTMQANRLPVQLDKFVKEKGIEASIDYIELTEYDENTYSYRVYFEEKGEAYFVDGLAGQVSIEIMDGEVKVSSISIVQ